MPVFLQGRRAFLSSLRRRHRRCNPLSVHRVSDSGLAYPRRAYSCFTYSCRACPAAAAACHSYSHLASPAAAAPLPPPSDTEAPHGPQPFPLGLKCRHGPCSFSCSTERRTADPRPCSARSTKKRTEPHKAPSAAKKQPICHGSGTAAGQSTLWKIIFSESLYSDTWKYQAITSSEEVSVSI